MRLDKVLGTSGAISRNCIAEVDGYHFVLTTSDVIVHDGQSARSILDKVARRKLFTSMDAENYTNSFVFKNPFLNEVYACYPEAGYSVPNIALVWNYVDETISYREIPNLNHADFGAVEKGIGQPWDGDDSPWNSDSSVWNAPEFTPDSARVMMASNDQKLLLLDSSTTFSGVIPTAYLERRGLSFGKPDFYKTIRGIRPRIFGTIGETIKIKVGYADSPYDEVTWAEEMTHVIGSTVADDCMVTGRYLAIRFESDTAYRWRLDSFDVDVVTNGRW